MGTAQPAIERTQAVLGEEIGGLLGLHGAERTRWDRIWRGSGIQTRRAVAPLEVAIGAGTAERMRIFDAHAPHLAAAAAIAALHDAGVAASEVTDLVVVTCTGFAAPGVPRRLFDLLGLDAGVRSSQIGFMGCFGGVCGLRAAAAHASADPRAVVLLVCVELCSLHLRLDRDPQNLVASALFGDGAAAAVVSCRTPLGAAAVRAAEAKAHAARAPRIRPGRSLTVPGTLDAMSWIVTDHGFAMTLSREVPEALASALPSLLPDECDVLVHPGGPAVIDAAASALRPEQRGAIEQSRAVLRDCGNMSSASILFVLERWRRAGGTAPASLVAFGPGLTIDLVTLDSV